MDRKTLWKRMKEEFYNHPLTIILAIIGILVGIIITILGWTVFSQTVLSPITELFQSITK